MPARLYVVPASHPCAAVEAALRIKGVAYDRVDLVPLAHVALQTLRFGRRTVPAIEFEDGVKVVGSRPIVRALEQRVPQPALLPADSEQRRQVVLAEEWGDEVLQPLVRRVVWAALRRAPGAMPSFAVGARLPVPPPLQKLSAPLVARAEGLLSRASDGAVRADLINLPHHLDRVHEWMRRGVLDGERPNAADLQVGASLALLSTIADVRVSEHPAGALAARFFPGYPGQVPAGTLPAAWLSAGRVPARSAARRCG